MPGLRLFSLMSVVFSFVQVAICSKAAGKVAADHPMHATSDFSKLEFNQIFN